MILVKSRFKYLDRGKDNLLVLVCGWASDWRIFSSLDLEFNYLFATDFSPSNFKQLLIESLRENNIDKISIFGWSLGGFLAAEFAAEYPNCIEKLILASVRKRYTDQELREMKALLKRNKQDCLSNFYNLCFAKGEDSSWFKQNLLSEYSKGLKTDYLLKGLDYLEGAQLNVASLAKITKLQIIHGEDDAIAPIAEAREIKDKLAQAKLIAFKKTGHMPFLKKDFNKYL